MQAGTIIARVRATLLDPNGDYWTDAELYDYLSAAQTAVAGLRLTALVSLAPGVLQVIPAGGAQLLEVTRSAGGGAIRQIDRDTLSHAVRDWAGVAPSATVLHYMADPRNPLRFHVYPPSDGTASVELVYAGIPPRVAAADDSLSLPDVFETALHAYVCALALAKNTGRGDLAKYQGFMGLFQQLVAGRGQGQFAEAPQERAV